MSGILGTAMSGLMAFQRSLDTTSHNIANVNTEGYSRQKVELSARMPQFEGGGYIGNGVDVSSVTRSYDQFITNQLNSSTSASAEMDSLSTMATRLDNIVSSEATGLSPALKSFFSAVNGVANDPTSLPARQVLISQSDTLSHQLNTLSGQFDSLRNETNRQMEGSVSDINALAENIADLNLKISVATSRSNNLQPPNDLLDQRDALITKISGKVSVTTLPQSDGSINLFIGKGQALVMGANSAKLSVVGATSDPSHKEILLGGQEIGKDITGGELAGAIKFRDQILDPAQQQLGLVAAGITVQFNSLHTTGFDLNGNAGTDMFSLGSPTLSVPVVSDPTNTGSITATYDAATVSQLTPSDYELSYDGTQYALKRLSDNTVTNFATAPITGPGFTITASAPLAANDSFLVRPTYFAAKNVNTVITDPAKIAAAGTTSGPGLPNTGDNTLALNLANLEKNATLLGGKSSLSGAYGQLVSQVGALTSSAKTGSAAQEALLNNAMQSRESLAGVNLDEEAANLLKFQQSYQAAAQVISVAHSLFDTLIGAMR